jgi:hypothetical protein
VKVAELIEHLKQYPGDADVWIQGEGKEMNGVYIVDHDEHLNFVHLRFSQDAGIKEGQG